MLKNERGYSLLMTIGTIVFISIIGLALMTMNANSMKTSKHEQIDQSVYYVAEAGINYYVVQVEGIIEQILKKDSANVNFKEDLLTEIKQQIPNYNDAEYNNFLLNDGRKATVTIQLDEYPKIIFNSVGEIGIQKRHLTQTLFIKENEFKNSFSNNEQSFSLQKYNELMDMSTINHNPVSSPITQSGKLSDLSKDVEIIADTEPITVYVDVSMLKNSIVVRGNKPVTIVFIHNAPYVTNGGAFNIKGIQGQSIPEINVIAPNGITLSNGSTVGINGNLILGKSSSLNSNKFEMNGSIISFEKDIKVSLNQSNNAKQPNVCLKEGTLAIQGRLYLNHVWVKRLDKTGNAANINKEVNISEPMPCESSIFTGATGGGPGGGSDLVNLSTLTEH